MSVNRERFEQHLNRPLGKGYAPEGASTGAAGGAACGDLVRISMLVEGERVSDIGFDASGCGSVVAAGSACVLLAKGNSIFDVARLGPEQLEGELGGLIPAKRHAVELAADALHRALGSAVQHASADFLPERSVVAMSGGVDSSVAALLAAERGDSVVAVTLELWADPANDAERSCCSASAVRSARSLAHSLGLPHFTLDLREEFRQGVVNPFIEGYLSGVTPNPCVLCNGMVRLDGMLDLATKLGAGKLITGHYARKTADGEGPLLQVAVDPMKDQSYMLCALAPSSLARIEFPLGELTKVQVREKALEAELTVARRPDSQDLCFLAGTTRDDFLVRHAGANPQPGPIVDLKGEVLGRHNGYHGFTVGQRRGIGIAASEPLYVISTDVEANRVTVGTREQLATDKVNLSDTTLLRDSSRINQVKLRYRSRPIPCKVTADGEGGQITLKLRKPAYGPAPGQTACLMDEDVVVGWGTILGG